MKSIHGIQQVCAAECLELTDAEVAQKLIAEGGLPHYAHLSTEAQHQVTSFLVLAEGDSQIAELIATPYEVAEQLPVLLAAHDIQLDPEALDALSLLMSWIMPSWKASLVVQQRWPSLVRLGLSLSRSRPCGLPSITLPR